jgi:mRNA-degrading endonuclease toxin of MazEF toxin-antitoxin module
MRRGEIRWYTFRAPDKRRPVLILSRDEVIDQLNELLVAPLTQNAAGTVDGGRAGSRRRNACGVCGQLRPRRSCPALSSWTCF